MVFEGFNFQHNPPKTPWLRLKASSLGFGDMVLNTLEKKAQLMRRRYIRNVAIVAYVDYGKTTLVDAMLKQSKVFRDNQFVQERIMESNDLERERVITILSKNTSMTNENTKINRVDTPGHSDFEVPILGHVGNVSSSFMGLSYEKIDAALPLSVDSVEGPTPQTRFVWKKALEFGHAVVVVVNKIDNSSARPDYVINSTFELFTELMLQMNRYFNDVFQGFASM
ncbi:hypothetical protein GH714_033273 [Hevea brasiliensis]|uniref:Tr-type G domain-containing protein n=1 Tax=Hevea brasiliensis TaxID=3981 RepID=A0A6A6M2L3_HEVBR|nr:hypothetical protein GH714_033273 [Hevea brasiliensis]